MKREHCSGCGRNVLPKVVHVCDYPARGIVETLPLNHTRHICPECKKLISERVE